MCSCQWPSACLCNCYVSARTTCCFLSMRWCWSVFTISLRKEVEAPGNRKHQSHCGAAVSAILNHHSQGLYGNWRGFLYIYMSVLMARYYSYCWVSHVILAWGRWPSTSGKHSSPSQRITPFRWRFYFTCDPAPLCFLLLPLLIN